MCCDAKWLRKADAPPKRQRTERAQTAPKPDPALLGRYFATCERVGYLMPSPEALQLVVKLLAAVQPCKQMATEDEAREVNAYVSSLRSHFSAPV